MKQITVRLPEERYEVLEQFAEQQGIPVAIVARSMILNALSAGEKRQQEEQQLSEGMRALSRFQNR